MGGSKTYGRASNGSSGGSKTYGGSLIDIFRGFIIGARDNQDIPRKFNNFLATYGQLGVKSITACRQPVNKFITDMLSIVSLGKFDKAKKIIGADDMFHVWFELQCFDSDLNSYNVILEKNQVLNIEMGTRSGSNVSKINITMPTHYDDSGRSYRKLIDFCTLGFNVLRDKGLNPFNYDARNNNCQRFLLAILEGNGALDQEASDFLLQDTEKLFDNLDFSINLITKGAVSTAQFFENLIQ